MTITAAISAVDELNDRFDLVADDGEGFAGGIDNVGDDPPVVCTVDDPTAADETTADELLEASNTVVSATGDDFNAAVLSAVIAADDVAGTAVLTIDSLATENANSADPGENGVGSRPSRSATMHTVASSVYRSIASSSGFIGFPESPRMVARSASSESLDDEEDESDGDSLGGDGSLRAGNVASALVVGVAPLLGVFPLSSSSEGAGS